MMHCISCGAELPEGCVFCTDCGARQDGPAAQPTPLEAQPQSEAYPTPPRAVRSGLGTGDFVLMELVRRIPLVSLIFFLIWGFSTDTEPNRKSWSRSQLIWTLIDLALWLIGILIAAAVGATLYDVIGSTVFQDMF